jgi:hypothetical protein
MLFFISSLYRIEGRIILENTIVSEEITIVLGGDRSSENGAEDRSAMDSDRQTNRQTDRQTTRQTDRRSRTGCDSEEQGSDLHGDGLNSVRRKDDDGQEEISESN